MKCGGRKKKEKVKGEGKEGEKRGIKRTGRKKEEEEGEGEREEGEGRRKRGERRRRKESEG